LAEALRVEFFWQVAGIRDPVGTPFAHESFLQSQDTELQWIRAALRAVSLTLALSEPVLVEGGLGFVRSHWIGDERAGCGQAAYYHDRLHRLDRRLHTFELIDRIMLVGGLLLALTFALDVALRASAASLLPAPLRGGMLWGLALVPVYAAILEIYVGEEGDRALIRQYRYMHALFRSAGADLLQEPQRGREILRALGGASLAEHAQWILAQRDKRIQGMRW
jgi:hypothetical protein